MRFDKNVWSAQAKNTLIYLQVWSWGLWLGHREYPIFRLELLTPARWFAIKIGRWHKTVRIRTLNPHYLRDTWGQEQRDKTH